MQAEMDLVGRVATEVQRRPAEISILHVKTRYGRRVLINLGADRFAHDHLVDYNIDTKAITTKRDLIGRKPALIQLAAEIAANCPLDSFLNGSIYPWPA